MHIDVSPTSEINNIIMKINTLYLLDLTIDIKICNTIYDESRKGNYR
jgi:hypothetical protein